jgi:ERCC4-type nuclease
LKDYWRLKMKLPKAKPKREVLDFFADDREKNPIPISYLKARGHNVSKKRLPTADFMLVGHSNFGIDRKNIDDNNSCILHEIDRFERELVRAKSMSHFYVLIEGSFQDIQSWNYHSKCSPKDLLQKMCNLYVKHNVKFILVDNARACGQMIECLAKAYLSEVAI